MFCATTTLVFSATKAVSTCLQGFRPAEFQPQLPDVVNRVQASQDRDPVAGKPIHGPLSALRSLRAGPLR
jgi:hypothetical protein